MTILILILFAFAAFVATPAVGPIGIVAGAIPTLALMALAARALHQPVEAPRASRIAALPVEAADERQLRLEDELIPPAQQVHG